MADNKDEHIVSIQLNFNKIYRLKIPNDEDKLEIFNKIEKDFNDLSNFEKGSQSHPGKGFIDFEDSFKNKLNAQKRLEETKIKNNILAKKFVYENYIKDLEFPQLIEAHVFLVKNNEFLAIKGGEKSCEKIEKYLLKFDSVGFEELNWNHDFLMWILYSFDQHEGKLLSNIDCFRIKKGRTEGRDSNENDIRSDNVQYKKIPLTILYGLLNKHEIRHLGAVLEKDHKNKLNVNLDVKKPLFVYANYSLKGKNYIEKCELILSFINDLIKMFERWERLDEKKKYPNSKFFKSIKKSFNDDIKNALEGFDDLQKKYEELRGKKNE